MTTRTNCHGLQVDIALHRFIEAQALPGTGISSESFWAGFSQIVHDLAPKNAALLAERVRLQAELDSWHRAHPGPITDVTTYREFLESIGYLQPVPAEVKVTTENVDAELATTAGPQLVVPVLNARYALNAANARWGSLYDALYGTDVISEADGASRAGAYNPVRGAKVIVFARNFLDQSVPLAKGSHADAKAYAVTLVSKNKASLRATKVIRPHLLPCC
jgi:malate synthase